MDFLYKHHTHLKPTTWDQSLSYALWPDFTILHVMDIFCIKHKDLHYHF